MKKKINLNNFTLGTKLGSGGYADVFIVTDKRTSKNYAAKKMQSYININPSKEEMENLNNDELERIRDINREIEILSMISHPTIITFYGFSPVFFDNTPYPTLIMELASKKSLGDLLNSARSGLAPDNWETKKYINIYGIAKGMSFIHGKKIIHRDLKPENILLNELLYPKISDFGFSKINDASQIMNSKTCGTPIYMAPEMFGLEEFLYDNKIDVYAFAMIMYEILTLEKPFANHKKFAIVKLLLENKRPDFPDDGSISDEFIELIKQCWSQDPESRPNFSEICQKLESNDFQMLKNIEFDDSLFDDYLYYLKQEVNDTLTSSEDQQVNDNTKNESKTVQFDLSQDKNDDIITLPSSRRATLPPKSTIKLQLNDKNKKQDAPLDDTNYSSDDNGSKENNDNSNESSNKEDNSTESNLKLVKSKSDKDSTDLTYWISPEEFEKLDQTCKKYYEAAINNDSNSLTYVGQSLIKGINGFPHNVDLGIKFLQKAVELNNQESMIIYGEMLLNGIQIPQNKQEGISLLTRASNDFESSQAKVKLAEFWIKPEKNEKGEITSLPNYPKAKKYCKEAANDGNVEAMVLYAQLCMREHNNDHGKIRRNLKEASKYLKIAIKNGSAEAMSVYGELKDQCLGIEKIDKEEAIKFFKESKEKGNNDGKSHYGFIKIKTKDEEKEGLKLIIDSKEEKNATAINTYGLVISNGLCSLPVNEKEAADCFKEAAEAGNANAMYNYAKCLEKGTGVEKNFKEAYKYYKFAFERGEIRAAKNIADMLFKGDDKSGFPTHLKSGNNYLKMLADYGNAAGINLYASNLLDGFGIDKNEKEAVYYLKNGIEKNDSNSLLLYGLFLLTKKDESAKSSDPSAYIKKAVQLGNEKAKEKCSVFVKGGINAKKNLEEAIKYVRDTYKKD